ncbi:hypothetical protein JW906_09430, partial [bacterium]|nr:hypothetical protein [bacterium]
MKILKWMIAVILCILFAPGCATFKSDMKGIPEGPQSKNFGAEKVDVLFVFSHLRQTRGLDAIPKLENEHERIRGFDDFFKDAYREFSNIRHYATFTEYASDVNDPKRRARKDSLTACHDFVIRMTFMRTHSFSKTFLATLASTVSLTVLPMPRTKSYSATAEVFDRSGRLVMTCGR